MLHREVTIVGQTYVVWKSFPGCHDHASVRAPGLGPTPGATSRCRGSSGGWRPTKQGGLNLVYLQLGTAEIKREPKRGNLQRRSGLPRLHGVKRWATAVHVRCLH